MHVQLQATQRRRLIIMVKDCEMDGEMDGISCEPRLACNQGTFLSHINLCTDRRECEQQGEEGRN